MGISGRTPVSALAPETRHRLGARSSLGIGPQATALYLGYLDPAGHALVDSPQLRRSVTTEPTFIWGAMFAESDRTRGLPRNDGPALLDATVQIFTERGWTPNMTEALDRSDPDSVAQFRFHAAPPDAADQIPWTTGPVTALGDAIHATPPTAGMGAGAAIRDSLDLTEALTAIADGADLDSPIEAYHRKARMRGSEVIAASLPTIRWILATGTPLGSVLTRAALPVMSTIDALRRPRSKR